MTQDRPRALLWREDRLGPKQGTLHDGLSERLIIEP